MKIIILGAGQVGASLAENLVSEKNDIIVIDLDAERLKHLQSKLDIACIQGHGSRPSVLLQAGAKDADMLIAVTSNDETNMIACQVAYSLYNIPTKLARIRSSDYLSKDEALFQENAIPIDFFISPERLITLQIKRLIEYPAAIQVVDFAKGKVQLVGIKPYFGGKMVGKTVREINEAIPNLNARLLTVYRGTRCIEVTADTKIEIGDEVFFIASRDNILAVMGIMRKLDRLNKRIMIVGGGNIGYRLAASLEQEYQVKIIEKNQQQASYISEKLNSTTILHGDASDKDLLHAENIEHMDVFCALTNDDEANIMSALLAKRMGAKQVMALVTRTAYIELIEDGAIDIAISPQQVTIGSILTHLRKGDIVDVYSLRRGAAEAMEIIAHGDKNTSKVVGKKVSELKLPKGATLAALIREEAIHFKFEDLYLEPGDHVIILAADKKHVHEIEKLFQVSIGYFK